nr:aminotransferase class V-fold PLP-dependent enzyme [uncultured Massilia sp.]
MTTPNLNRRTLLCGAAGLALGAHGAADAAATTAAGTGAAAAVDWDALARNYDVATEFVNLENAYLGVMARPVLEAYRRNIDVLNRGSSQYLRTRFDSVEREVIRARLAAHTGVAPGELALTRNACESLQNLICNYRLLRPGDVLMMGDLDYDVVQDAMAATARRGGHQLVTVQTPEPATRQGVIDAYEQALRQHPRTRLLLLTHVNNRTGLVTPVAEIVRMAKRRDVDVVVDIAQSWGQLDYAIPDLGADFVGANLHKWIGAPPCSGFLTIRASRLQDIAPHAGNTLYPDTDVRARVHAGTMDVPAVMTIPAALDFHGRVKLADRAARLRQLRDRWVHQVRELPGVQVLTPEDPTMYGALTSFRLRGKTSYEDNVALARRLADEYGIFTVARKGPAGGACIRVTPSWFTRNEDLDRLAAAIKALAG